MSEHPLDRRLVAAGDIEAVLRAACTSEGLVAVTPKGFGVGAGAVASSSARALDQVSDSTFLFDTLIASHLPLPTQLRRTEQQLATNGERFYSPVMAYFWGQTPDEILVNQDTARRVSQGDFVNDLVWSAREEDVAAIGFVGTAHVRTEDVVGALISGRLTPGSCDLAAEETVMFPQYRSLFFDTDPLRWWRGTETAYLWYTGVSVRREVLKGNGPLSALRRVFYQDPASDSMEPNPRHCHAVMVPKVPRGWLHGSGPWEELSAEGFGAEETVVEPWLMFHVSDACEFRPAVVALWMFREHEIHVEP